MAGNKIILNKRSNAVNNDGTPTIPTSEQLQYGEIAINYADGVETLSIKNSNNNIVTLPINQQNIKKLLFNDLWLSLPSCNVNGENYSYINNIYTYENAIKKYHELLAVVDGNYIMIDLGLPSGTLWADRNIGATDIYDGGKLFQWGDPTPYDIPEHTNGTITEGQKMFRWKDYKWNPSGDGSTFTKYNNTDRKTTLDPEDDAARVNMGHKWKMPTQEQVAELFKGTTQELYAKLTDNSDPVKVAEAEYDRMGVFVQWTYIDGHTKDEASGKLAYMVLTSKTNGNSLVVPSSVYTSSGNVTSVGYGGFFWLSSLVPQKVDAALRVGFYYVNYIADYYRYNGLGVRGVVGQ